MEESNMEDTPKTQHKFEISVIPWRILGPNNINQDSKKMSEIDHKFLDSVDKVSDGIMCICHQNRETWTFTLHIHLFIFIEYEEIYLTIFIEHWKIAIWSVL